MYEGMDGGMDLGGLHEMERNVQEDFRWDVGHVGDMCEGEDPEVIR